MTKAELQKLLAQFPDDAEVLACRTPRPGRPHTGRAIKTAILSKARQAAKANGHPKKDQLILITE